MRKKILLMIIGLGLIGVNVPVSAHHAFGAEFDANKPVKMTGTVTSMEWTNPHSWIYIDVKGSDGKVVNWAIEAGAPNAMFRRGFRKDALPVGTVIQVDGFQAKDGTPKANGRNVTLPSGQVLFVGSAGTGAPDDPSGAK